MSPSLPTIDLSNVKKKNKLIELLPWVGRGTSTAIYPNVYLSSIVYSDIRSTHADPYHVCVVIHEQEHLKRIKHYGVIKWYARYVMSRRFRFEEELAAMRPQLAFLKQQGLTFNLERRARSLSGWIYLWAISYEDALRQIRELWKSA